MPRPPAHNRDQDAPGPSRNRTRSDENLHRAVALPPEDAPDRRPPTALEQQSRDDGAHDGGDAFEDRRTAQGETGVFRPAAGAVEGGILPCRREAAALNRSGPAVNSSTNHRREMMLTNAPKMTAKK